jgi:hypothetical protein
LAGLGKPLRAGVEQALRRFIMEAFQTGPRIELSALGSDAVPIGALELAGLHEPPNNVADEVTRL